MVSTALIQDAVERYFAANAALDAAAVARLFAPDARMYRVPGEAPLVGREAIGQVYHQLLAAIARFDAPPARIFIQGDGAAVLYRGQLTAQRGGTVAVEGINVYAVDEAGLIAEIRYYWDPTPVYAVLRGEAVGERG
jgi:steroid delta-isomerase